MARTSGQDIGEALERAVLEGCQLYLAQGVARIDKVATPIAQLTRVGPDGTFRARHMAKAHTDFLGYWVNDRHHRQGDVIAIECKATNDARLPLSRIEPQQRAWLRDCGLWGGYVLVHFVGLGAVRLVPFHKVDRERGSIGPDDGWAVSAVEFLKPLMGGAV